MRKGRILNDLRVKTFTFPDDSDHQGGSWITTKGGKRLRIIHGMSTRKYYDSSNPRYRIASFRMDQLVSFTELAIRFYNFKEHTKFGQVKVLKVVRSLSGVVGYRITFEAFSPAGVASVFVAKVTQFLNEYYTTIEIRSVKLKRSDSDQKGKRSQKDLPPNIPQQQTLSDASVNDVAPYISQYALSMYNIFTLNLKKEPLHDISSVRVVKAMKHNAPSRKVVKGKKHDAEGSTYLVTFEASLRNSEARLIQGLVCKMCFVKKHEETSC
ncbi:hypothetical protein POM88_052686 [Heracleum sosnowskyi]|uniref:Uncharacterized protein n=1 Tax=Heracleum sosnowskyi TaxID=360622 RepID=A0AAD8LYA9_9APIA|nr:hypothetical protein POM88_052686 [Heracleum sosnowskyi]